MSDRGTMGQGNELRCPGCGAPVPIGAGATSRCAFCLDRVEVPPRLRKPVIEGELLDAKLEAAARGLGAARSGTRAGRRGLWLNLTMMVLVIAVCALTQAASLFSRAEDPISAIRQDPTLLVNPLLTLGAYGVSALLIVASLGFGRLMEFRRLTRVPLSLPRGTRASCPSCGDTLRPSGQVTATCGSCRTESLLPAHLVSASLRHKHHRVAQAHREIEHHRGGQARGAALSHGCAGLAYLGFGITAAVGIPAGLWLASWTGWIALDARQILFAGAIPAVVIGVSFAWSARPMLLHAYRGLRGPSGPPDGGRG